MTDVQKTVVKAYAEQSMNTRTTAKALHYHPNNIYEHLNRVREKTGLDPRNFFDLIKLYDMATGGADNGD